MTLLVFDPRQTWARLCDYDPTDRTVGITLCPEHADAVSVPAGWTIVDDRSGAPRLAAVPAQGPPDSEVDHRDLEDEAPTDEDGQDQDTTADDPDDPDGDTDETDEDTEGSPTLWSVDDREPADDLDVDESTPLLNRAFRAAHLD